MNLPQGHTDGPNWHEHIELVKKYSGTMKAYCRLHNLDYDKFIYYRGRVINSQPMAVSSFAKVQAVDRPSTAVLPSGPVIAAAVAGKAKNYPQMPDPKWLAELIHNLADFK